MPARPQPADGPAVDTDGWQGIGTRGEGSLHAALKLAAIALVLLVIWLVVAFEIAARAGVIN